jgi:hypothetical protein
MGSASILASLALILWVPICLLAFVFLRPHVAATVALLGSSLLLPEIVAFDLPGVPPIGKREMGCLAALLGTALVARRPIIRPARAGWPLDLACLVLVASGVATALANGDPVRVGPRVAKGLDLWEGISTAGGELLFTVTPFLLGRALIRTRHALSDLLVVIVVLALGYALLILFEVRMAPKLHREIYGFNVQKTLTTRRLGGYRPTVFMVHGLALATFVLSALVASVALWKAGIRLDRRVPPGPVAVFLGLVFLACRSMTQYLYGLVMVPVALFGRPRAQLSVAALIAAVVLFYPTLRSSGLLPTQELLGLARWADLPRLESLESRFLQEDLMLEKALERPLFGWGSSGRRRVYVEDEERILVSDGFWIIVLGQRGVVGFLCVFTLLLYPVFSAWRRFPALPAGHRSLVAALALVIAINAFDFLPNGFHYPHHMFLSGSLVGALEVRRRRHAPGSRGQPRSASLPAPRSLGGV